MLMSAHTEPKTVDSDTVCLDPLTSEDIDVFRLRRGTLVFVVSFVWGPYALTLSTSRLTGGFASSQFAG